MQLTRLVGETIFEEKTQKDPKTFYLLESTEQSDFIVFFPNAGWQKWSKKPTRGWVLYRDVFHAVNALREPHSFSDVECY